jgi:hypothetical protein
MSSFLSSVGMGTCKLCSVPLLLLFLELNKLLPIKMFYGELNTSFRSPIMPDFKESFCAFLLCLFIPMFDFQWTVLFKAELHKVL